jgi:hypothetical protein
MQVCTDQAIMTCHSDELAMPRIRPVGRIVELLMRKSCSLGVAIIACITACGPTSSTAPAAPGEPTLANQPVPSKLGPTRLQLPKGTAVAVPGSKLTLKFVGSGWATPIDGGHVGFVDIEVADGARTKNVHVSQYKWSKLQDTFGMRWRLAGKIIDGAEFPSTIEAEIP